MRERSPSPQAGGVSASARRSRQQGLYSGDIMTCSVLQFSHADIVIVDGLDFPKRIGGGLYDAENRPAKDAGDIRIALRVRQTQLVPTRTRLGAADDGDLKLRKVRGVRPCLLALPH